MASTSASALGAFLYQLRIESGSETISDFLRQHARLPFTANYYRDVEAGRKTLSIDGAIQLHDALNLDESQSIDFFWHYFRDVLPVNIHETLFGRRAHIAPNKLRDINQLRDYDADLQRRALAISRYEREFIVGDDIAALFQLDFDLLPLMTYVYMVSRASQDELQLVCTLIGVDFDERVEHFLSAISTVKVTSGIRYYSRILPVLRMPRTETGLELKDRFLVHEVNQSLGRPDSSEFFPPGGTFRTSSMVAIRSNALDMLQRRIIDLITELDVHTKSNDQLDDDNAFPYFFSLVISGRPEYDGRPARPRHHSRREDT